MGVTLSSKQQHQISRIQEFIAGSLSRKDCALLLNLSERSVSRIAKAVQLEGLSAILHGNTGKVPSNKYIEQKDSNHNLSLHDLENTPALYDLYDSASDLSVTVKLSGTFYISSNKETYDISCKQSILSVLANPQDQCLPENGCSILGPPPSGVLSSDPFPMPTVDPDAANNPPICTADGCIPQ